MVVKGFELVLQGLGVETEGAHFRDTAKRAAKAWFGELCAGLNGEVPAITTFPTEVDEMVVARGIPIKSICAHHLLPFLGTATIGYVPGTNKLLGVSKISRVADYWARRPQVQEELTDAIADCLAAVVVQEDKMLGAVRGGVGVVIRARHLCMECRGVNHSGEMITSALRGVFLTKPEARQEFLRLDGP